MERRSLVPGVLAAFAVAAISAECRAGTIFVDDFSGSSIGAGWTTTFIDAGGWTQSVSGGQLDVTDISPSVVNPGSGGTWARAQLSRSFAPVGDFHLDFDIGWDSAASVQAMQCLFVRLYDPSDVPFVLAGYYDAWVASAGGEYGGVGASDSFTGLDSLPHSGTAAIDIDRTGGSITIRWNGSTLHTGTGTSPLARVDVEFWYYAYSGGGGPSFFGTESVDRVALTGTQTVPLPTSGEQALAGAVAAALASVLVRRRRR